LPKVVGWYRRFAAGEAARDLMLKDLAEYHGL
jgi:hypothetical protein